MYRMMFKFKNTLNNLCDCYDESDQSEPVTGILSSEQPA